MIGSAPDHADGSVRRRRRVGRPARTRFRRALLSPRHGRAENRRRGAVPVYDKLYDLMADLGLVLAVHEGLGVRGPTVGADRFTTFAGRHVCSHPLEQMTAMASLVLDGALERHPTLKVAFLESGTGWLPYWLARLDEHIEWMTDSETAGLRPATEYFARQCVISTDPEDRLAAWAVTRVGAEHVVWASDFPHPDASFPDAFDVFRSHSPELTGPDLDAVLWDTPVGFYGLYDRFHP